MAVVGRGAESLPALGTKLPARCKVPGAEWGLHHLLVNVGRSVNTPEPQSVVLNIDIRFTRGAFIIHQSLPPLWTTKSESGLGLRHAIFQKVLYLLRCLSGCHR